jgi:hypothetical protein
MIEEGSQVVLVVTGRRPRARVEGPHVRTVDPDAADVLAALGLDS